MKKLKINFLNELKDKYAKYNILNNIYKPINFEYLKTIVSKNSIKRIKSQLKIIIDNKLLNPTLLFQKIQDKVEGIASIDSNQVVLKQSRFWAKSITWVLISGTTFAIGWISVAKTDEVVIAFGKLVPTGGVVDIQMPLEGIAEEILIKEGQILKDGSPYDLINTKILSDLYNISIKVIEQEGYWRMLPLNN